MTDPTRSPAVEYDLHNWSQDDIAWVFARVKRWCIPYRWDESTRVLTVQGMYEEAMNKLVLGDD